MKSDIISRQFSSLGAFIGKFPIISILFAILIAIPAIIGNFFWLFFFFINYINKIFCKYVYFIHNIYAKFAYKKYYYIINIFF